MKLPVLSVMKRHCLPFERSAGNVSVLLRPCPKLSLAVGLSNFVSEFLWELNFNWSGRDYVRNLSLHFFSFVYSDFCSRQLVSVLEAVTWGEISVLLRHGKQQNEFMLHYQWLKETSMLEKAAYLCKVRKPLSLLLYAVYLTSRPT